MAIDLNSIPRTYAGAATQAQQTNTDALTPWTAMSTGGVGVSGTSEDADPFWSYKAAADLRGNWNKSFPFQILILNKDKGIYNIDDSFTLPIPPQSLSISTPFAINTSVTMGGILEEHNGAPLRTISLTGTTGLLPLRGAADRPPSMSLLGSVFAGTIAGFNKTLGALKAVLGGGLTEPNVNGTLETWGLETSTGYYQFLLLQRFLESYITRKRFESGGRSLRLAFAIWKESAIYLVTPVSFDVQRNAASPLEYTYSLQFRAWSRIDLNSQNGGAYPSTYVGVRSQNTLAKLMNGLQSVRKVLVEAQNTIKAVRADVDQTLYEPLRQVVLLAKDAMGVAITAADLPSNLVSDLKDAILELSGGISGLGADAAYLEGTRGRLNQSTRDLMGAIDSLAGTSGKMESGAGRVPEQGPADPLFDASPAAKAIQNPGDHFATFDSIKISDLNLRPDNIKQISEQRSMVQDLQRKDFEKFRSDTQAVLSDFSNAVGAGDPTFARIYGLPDPPVTSRTPTDDEWEVIHSLSQLAQNYDYLIASEGPNTSSADPMEYVAGLASRSGIAFRVARSKFAVPMPYGHTLEQLSNLYLGDPNRWQEIATLNGLQSPYVDEVGFSFPLLTNGNGNQVSVGTSANLFVNQTVWLGSSGVQRESRRIQKVDILSPGETRLTLNGEPDLEKFTTSSAAKLQAFLPNTVNSQMQLYIPSDQDPGTDDFLTKEIPGVDYFDPLVKSGGIDLLLTPGGDLVFTPDGDNRLAVGLNNLIQKVRLALGTPRGSLLHHPDYGLNLRPGTSTADLDVNAILAGARDLFKGDPGFTGVAGVAVRKDGSNLHIKLGVGITGTGQTIPVQTLIRR